MDRKGTTKHTKYTKKFRVTLVIRIRSFNLNLPGITKRESVHHKGTETQSSHKDRPGGFFSVRPPCLCGESGGAADAAEKESTFNIRY